MIAPPPYNVPPYFQGDSYWAYRSGYEAGYVRGTLRQTTAPVSQRTDSVDREEGALLRYIEELADALESSANFIEEWGTYADDYFQIKHCLAADIAYVRSHAKRARAVAHGIDLLGEYDV